MANTLKLHRDGAVSFIDWLGRIGSCPNVSESTGSADLNRIWPRSGERLPWYYLLLNGLLLHGSVHFCIDTHVKLSVRVQHPCSSSASWQVWALHRERVLLCEDEVDVLARLPLSDQLPLSRWVCEASERQ